MYLRLLLPVSLAVVLSASGCGLALDFGPPDRARDAQGSGLFDANVEHRDGGAGADASMDAARADGGEAMDAGLGEQDATVISGDATNTEDAVVTPLDGFVTTVDAFVPPVDSFVRPVDAFVPPSDAFVPRDASTDAGTSTMRDAGRDALVPIDSAPADCTGSLPGGATGMCDLGDCLCSTDGLCYAAASATGCCLGGGLTCSAPPTDCMGTHPIVIGTTRTCASGQCYCGNPDACFPPDQSLRCCAVPVICVP